MADKTLIVLTPGFPESGADTTCLPFLQTHINAVNKTFPELEIIIIAFQYPFFEHVYKWNNNEVISLGGRERSKLHRLQIWWRVWNELKRLRKEKNVTGLFSLWCTECAMTGSWFGKFYGLKHFTWLCGQDAKPGNRYVKLTRPKAGELIAMSDFLKREFAKNYGIVPAHVIPLGADPDEFADKEFARNIDVSGIGSLIPLKQYTVFVKVVHELTKSMPGINTVICGKGPEEGLLKDLISTLKLENNVRLAGEIPHSDALQLMQQSKIFMHTSNYEGLGTVCIEALYAGAHVVSFTKPMDIDIPHWHHVSNEAEMAAKVKELLENPATRYERVCAWSSGDIAGMMMGLYNG